MWCLICDKSFSTIPAYLTDLLIYLDLCLLNSLEINLSM